MTLEKWADVDNYLHDLVAGTDPALDGALADSAAAGLPAISVAASQGKFLALLVSIRGAQKILEIGTLGGYSTIWLARAMAAGGTLVTLEADPKHAEVAQANLDRAGLLGVVDLRLGQAIHTLGQLASEGAGPFDLVFIDADKVSTVEYFEWALKLTRPGSVIVVDNVVRNGALADEHSSDVNVRAMRRFIEKLKLETRVNATVIQTVGAKGYDGFALALVL